MDDEVDRPWTVEELARFKRRARVVVPVLGVVLALMSLAVGTFTRGLVVGLVLGLLSLLAYAVVVVPAVRRLVRDERGRSSGTQHG